MDPQSQTLGASPSTAEGTAAGTAENAPSLPFPSAHHYSIEYPGYVNLTSVPLALNRLGGPSQVYQAFQRNGSKPGSHLELAFEPSDAFLHPLDGEVLSTNNLLLKIVKRRRKQGGTDGETVGEYTAQIVGSISKTARFRSMADYQYRANVKDPVVVLRSVMDRMDVNGILQYSIPEEKEDFVIPRQALSSEIDPQLLSDQVPDEGDLVSNLRLPPPPLFSRQSVPQNYNYKMNTASIISTTTDDVTGEERTRLINRMRWKGYGPVSLYYADKEVPTKPTASVEAQRAQADQKILKRLQELFANRPVWARAAIYNQFDAHEVREIINSKILLSLVSYVFQDGPWRDTQVRLGFDPRTDPEARFYQRLYFRNINKHIVRPSVTGRRQDGRNEIANARASDGTGKDKRSHVFDGVTVTKETAAFQLCDIEDEMLKEMIEDEEDLRESCNERDGWYSTYAFEQIKSVLRYKFFSLLSGHIPTREECEARLVPAEEATKTNVRASSHRLRPGKHNMAKGALRPEDAAAQRLSAAIDQRLKEASQR